MASSFSSLTGFRRRCYFTKFHKKSVFSLRFLRENFSYYLPNGLNSPHTDQRIEGRIEKCRCFRPAVKIVTVNVAEEELMAKGDN